MATDDFFRARPERVNGFATPGIMNLLWMARSVFPQATP